MLPRKAPSICAAIASALIFAATGTAFAQIGNSKCVDRTANDGRKVSSTQNKENRNCIKAAGSSKLVGTIEACTTADSKGKVTKRRDRVSGLFGVGNTCEALENSDLVSNGATVNSAQQTESLAFIHDVFGADLDGGQIVTTSPERKCQDRIANRAGRFMDEWLKGYRSCQRAAISGGAGDTAAVLAACLSGTGINGTGSALIDGSGKVGKAGAKLGKDIVSKCTDKGVDTDAAAPGVCVGGGVQGNFSAYRMRPSAAPAVPRSRLPISPPSTAIWSTTAHPIPAAAPPTTARF